MQALGYGQDQLSYRWWRLLCRVAAGLALGVLIGLLFLLIRAIYIRAAWMYWQRKCSTFEPIPLNSSTAAAEKKAEAVRCWVSFRDAVGRFGTYVPRGYDLSEPPILYMHELVCPNGSHEIVTLVLDSDWHSAEFLSWRTIGCNSHFEPGLARYGGEWVGMDVGRVLVVDSVMVDASNRSQLVVHGHDVDCKPSLLPSGSAPGPRVIRIRLQDDGTLKIVEK